MPPPPHEGSIASPVLVVLTRPSAMVTPAMVTLTAPLTSKIRLLLLPLIVNLPAPGPSIVRLVEIGSSPDVSVMEWMELANSMVSPGTACAMAYRSDRAAPLSALDVTMDGELLRVKRFSRHSSLSCRPGALRRAGRPRRDGATALGRNLVRNLFNMVELLSTMGNLLGRRRPPSIECGKKESNTSQDPPSPGAGQQRNCSGAEQSQRRRFRHGRNRAGRNGPARHRRPAE